jgi:hypothetical protein
MICPGCGAFVEQGTFQCPHCLKTLPPDLPAKKKSGWWKGCLGCGCGCLGVILLFLAVLGYGIYMAWSEVSKQIQTEPLVLATSQLDEQQLLRIQEQFAELEAKAEERNEGMVNLTLDQAQVNYLFQKAIDIEGGPKETLFTQIELVGDSIKATYSLKLGENRYFNGRIGFFLVVDNQQARFRLKNLSVGAYVLQPTVIDQINSYISDQQVSEVIREFNAKPRDEFPFRLLSFQVKDDQTSVSLQSKP